MSIPLELRTQERQQLDEYIPQAIETLRGRGLNDEADDVVGVTLIEEEDGRVSTTVDQWVSLLSSLRVIDDGLRPWWLRKKLSQRLAKATDTLDGGAS